MMKTLYGLLIFLIITVQTGCADNSKISSHLNLDTVGLAVQGYDPVSYHNGKPVKGKKEYSYVHDNAKYLFSNQNNMDTFQNNPDTYLPAFGGWCAWAMLDGEKVVIDPESYKIINGITYLFFNSFFNDTLSKWNTRAELETDNILIQKARFKWAELNRKE
jgi:YHS domain-containing protein